MHKTGSSSIQQNLARAGKLYDWELLSINKRPNMGPVLHAMFNPNSHEWHWFKKKGYSVERLLKKADEWRQKFAADVHNSNTSNFIISAETLSTFEKGSLIQLKCFLESIFDEICVIGYVRPPVAFKISMFQERIKQSAKKNIITIKGINIDYRIKFEKFDEVFGKERVLLKKFDPQNFFDRCIVKDFCKEVGIQLSENFSVIRVNERLSKEACGLLYAYRQFGPGYGVGRNVIKENIQLIRVLQKMKGSELKFSASLVGEILEENQMDIAWMEERLGVSLMENLDAIENVIHEEKDLLEITHRDCEAFAKCFQDAYKVKISSELVPQSNPVELVQVAEMLEFCRQIIRSKIKPKNRLIGIILRRVGQFFTKKKERCLV
ncbi:MAG: hypothetical protein HC845_06015 [Akkermansiaceae bacterium]|nr:hypothetical protein [Akkermansiaceae bacterium]